MHPGMEVAPPGQTARPADILVAVPPRGATAIDVTCVHTAAPGRNSGDALLHAEDRKRREYADVLTAAHWSLVVFATTAWGTLGRQARSTVQLLAQHLVSSGARASKIGATFEVRARVGLAIARQVARQIAV